MSVKDIKTLHGQFLAEYDQDAAGEIWFEQSKEFKELWDESLPSKGKLDPEDIDHNICFLDSNAKGIRDTDIEPAGRVLIPQGGWRRKPESRLDFGRLSVVKRMLQCYCSTKVRP